MRHPFRTHVRVRAATMSAVLIPALSSPGMLPSVQPENDAASAPGLALSGQLELTRLVDLAAQRLGLVVEYDPRVLQGTVTLRSGFISDDELWPLVNRLLTSRGFTTVRLPGDDAFSVVKIQDAANLARIEPDEAAGERAGFQNVVIRAKHRQSKELIEAVKHALSRPGGSAVELGPGGLILISDTAARIDAAIWLLERLDQPGTASVEEIQTHNLSATNLAAIVMSVAQKREAITGEKIPGEVIPSPSGVSVLLIAPTPKLEWWRSLIASLDQREAVQTTTYAPRYFPPADVAKLIEETLQPVGAAPQDERLRIVVDELTGSLIVTATAPQHEQIATIMERLDNAPAAARRPVRTYTIRNRSVTELQAILERLVTAGALEGALEGADSAELANPSAPTVAPSPLTPRTTATSPLDGEPAMIPSPNAPAGSAPLAAGVPDLTLTADEATSTLIAFGDPRLLVQLEELIRALDVLQPQVMLEVLIVSLSESQSLALGTELQAQLDLSGDMRANLSSLFGLGSTAGGGGGTGPAPAGGGFTGLVLAPGDWSVLVRALETLTEGRTLNVPKVVVNNNEQAVLTSQLEQPYASINASNTVSTTSFGGTLPAGTSVALRPQIAQGDHLLLEYDVSLSAFVGASPSSGLPPPRQQNQVRSEVTVPDGYTVVLGGLDISDDTEAVAQIPLVGNIPILGELFKNRTINRSKSRFYVFIRPSVMRGTSFESLKWASDQAAESMGVEDGWPEVEPRIIR